MILIPSLIGRMEIPQRMRIKGQRLQRARQPNSNIPKLFRINKIPIAIRINAQKT
jgi:hypothetical protein